MRVGRWPREKSKGEVRIYSRTTKDKMMKEEENEIPPGSSVSFNMGLCSITQCSFSQTGSTVGMIPSRL